jgi:AcrR family transcriptional regulator
MPVVLRRSGSSDNIIAAAGKLFARQGYHGTSTRQIAHLAGVGEVTIFRQFDHKEGLFRSTLRHHSSGLKLRNDLHDALVQCGAPEVVLPKILDMLNDIVIYKPELLRMIAIALLELHWSVESFGDEYLLPAVSQISQYLETNINAGRIRGVNSTMLTTALMMTSVVHPAIFEMVGGDQPQHKNGRTTDNAYAKFWLDLLVPRQSFDPKPHAELPD